VSDDPLSKSDDSVWKDWHTDEDLRTEIAKARRARVEHACWRELLAAEGVRQLVARRTAAPHAARSMRQDADRTLPDYAFFNREQPRGRLHHGALSRVLFVYAALPS
jgi:hypothetical protein